MGKWLDRLKVKEKTSLKELTKLTKGGSVSFVSSQHKDFEKNSELLKRLLEKKEACLALRTWPHYKTFSKETLQAEQEALQRLDKDIHALRGVLGTSSSSTVGDCDSR